MYDDDKTPPPSGEGGKANVVVVPHTFWGFPFSRCDGLYGTSHMSRVFFTRCPMATKPPKITRLPRTPPQNRTRRLIGHRTRSNKRQLIEHSLLLVMDQTKSHLNHIWKSSYSAEEELPKSSSPECKISRYTSSKYNVLSLSKIEWNEQEGQAR